MNEIPGDLRFKKSHEWVRVEADGSVTIGISDHAQDLLGDIVFVELPEIGTQMSAEDEVAIVESVKAASDVYSPISGEIIEVNEVLLDNPEIINESPYHEGWFYKLQPSDSEEIDELLSPEQYGDICEE
ncbi:MAG: glycine cleavage system protein GcvH [Gammaproteobacteria bacterium]|jgi:glycine cleavage system H protein|uniref:Glycine cleavage system H protein n=1 Tax=SAR86 cluster bacterium TaxID=2030880 RepID=A0A368C7B6_9GAMM|nr:MAG: glycine cleavage system protein GcvH [SAR86 cluster bacterium]